MVARTRAVTARATTRSRTTRTTTRRRTTRQVVTASIGRFDGGELKPYCVKKDDKVSVLLTMAGISLAKGEEVLDGAGETVSIDEKVKQGEEYFLSAKYDSGN